VRKSKCKCLNNKIKCNKTCSCKDCKNGKPESSINQIAKRKEGRKRFISPRTTAYLDRNYDSLPSGRWTNAEYITLLIIKKKKKESETIVGLKIDNKYYFIMYNRVVNYIRDRNINSEIPIRNKSEKQIASKLEHSAPPIY